MNHVAVPDHTMTTEQRARFERNVSALRSRQPDVADAILAAGVPDCVVSAIGRDGSTTFQLVSDVGPPTWFGRSSMPTISATEVFADAQFRNGNAALPGILTGLEPHSLLKRMPRSTALFVLEDDPQNLSLAFHLYDYGDTIGAGRLLFVLTGAFGANLAALIRRYPGYEMPGHLYHVPQRSTAELVDLQRRLESAGQAAVDVQNGIISTALSAIAARSYGPIGAAPRVALLCADSHVAALEQVNRVARALAGLGWAHTVCAPFTPDQCHALARLRAIDSSEAEFVLFIGHGANHLRGALPPDLPVVSWFVGSSGSETLSPAPSRPFDFVVEARPADGGQDAPDEIAAVRRLRVEPSADDRAFSVNQSLGASDRGTDVDVAIPVDLPDDRADACGITLASHAMLWREVRRIVDERIDRPAQPEVELILSDAARAAGITIDDAGVRAQIAGLIRTRAIPASTARSLAAACQKAGLRVTVFGSNWFDHETLDVSRGGEVPTGSGVNHQFDQASVVVLPSCDVQHVRMALDALCTGAVVCLRADADEFAHHYPGLTDISEFLTFAPTARTLARRAKELVSSALRSPVETERTTRTEALARHSVASRLLWIIDQARVRKRTISSTVSGCA